MFYGCLFLFSQNIWRKIKELARKRIKKLSLNLENLYKIFYNFLSLEIIKLFNLLITSQIPLKKRTMGRYLWIYSVISKKITSIFQKRL